MVCSIVPKNVNVFSVFPQSCTIQGVCTGLQGPGMVTFKVFPPDNPDGHLVQVAEFKQELNRCGAAAHNGCVVSDTPVLALGIWIKKVSVM